MLQEVNTLDIFPYFSNRTHIYGNVFSDSFPSMQKVGCFLLIQNSSDLTSSPSKSLTTHINKDQPSLYLDGENNTSPRRFQCQPCSKSFTNQHTFLEHQKSSKHLKIVKKTLKPLPTLGREKQAKSTAKNATSRPHIAGDKAGESLLMLKKAHGLEQSQPNLAVSLYWKVSNDLWELGYVRDVVFALLRLVTVLSALKEETCNGPSVTVPASPSLSPGQIKSTLYSSQVALARIFACFKALHSEAAEWYQKASRDYWNISLGEYTLTELSIHTHLKEISKNAGSNLNSLGLSPISLSKRRAKLSIFLFEMASFLMVMDASQSVTVLECYAIRLNLLQSLEQWDDYLQCQKFISSLLYSLSPAAIAGEWLLTPPNCYPGILFQTTTCSWLLYHYFVALCWCLRHGDIVRAKAVVNSIAIIKSNLSDPTLPCHVQYAIDLYAHYIKRDYDFFLYRTSFLISELQEYSLLKGNEQLNENIGIETHYMLITTKDTQNLLRATLKSKSSFFELKALTTLLADRLLPAFPPS